MKVPENPVLFVLFLSRLIDILRCQFVTSSCSILELSAKIFSPHKTFPKLTKNDYFFACLHLQPKCKQNPLYYLHLHLFPFWNYLLKSFSPHKTAPYLSLLPSFTKSYPQRPKTPKNPHRSQKMRKFAVVIADFGLFW